MTIPISKHKSVIKSASVVSSLTMVSRILGYLRDAVIGYAFGGNKWYTDIFFLSFEIPNFCRRLLGEGALSAAFISVFTDYLTNKEKKDAWEFASNVVNLLFLLTATLVILGIILTPVLVYILIPGYRHNQLAIATAIKLTRIMFPYLGFIAFAALFMGILNSLRHFAMPAATPIFLNLSMIIAAIWISPLFGSNLENRLTGLALGVIIGGFLQAAVQVPVALKKGMHYTVRFNYRHPGVIRVAKMLIPAVFGLAITQINLAVDKICASLVGEGTISALYYGNRLVELPESVFGIAIAVAVMPVLATHAAKKEFLELKETLAYGLRLAMFLTIPAAVGLIILRIPILSFLFERGMFTAQATEGAAVALLFYSLGLFSFAAVKIVVPVFYALEDVWVPVKVGFIAVAVNTVLNLSLMWSMKQGGLALATTISSTVNWVLLLYLLRKRVGLLGLKKVTNSFLRILAASAVMGLGCYVINGWYVAHIPISGFIAKLVYISVVIGVSAIIFLGASWGFSVHELQDIWQIIRNKILLGRRKSI
ncbi:MAG: murein biosynthesis integral membrane protein MurJ [bacterium]|nr:murein biosynthesis integral membrane protein MurJ [bacterium]